MTAPGAGYIAAEELAAAIGKKPSGGHWNSGITVLRNNGLIEIDGRRYRTATIFRKISESVYRTSCHKSVKIWCY
jgi:hypothetical protein